MFIGGNSPQLDQMHPFGLFRDGCMKMRAGANGADTPGQQVAASPLVTPGCVISLSLFSNRMPRPSETVKPGAIVSLSFQPPHTEGLSWCPCSPSSRAELGSWQAVPRSSPCPKPSSPHHGKVSWWAPGTPWSLQIGPGSAGSLSGCTMSCRPHCLSGRSPPLP